MRSLLLLSLSLLVFSTSSCLAQSTDFHPLFNGEDLSGWYGLNPHKLKGDDEQKAKIREEQAKATADHWRVEDGVLVNSGTGPYLTTKKEYGDAEILIEYKTVAKADSGIYLRGTPQVQIWDWTEEGGKWKNGADKGSGGLFNNAKDKPGRDPLELADRPFGEWNSFRIVQVGARTSVWFNGKHVVQHAIMDNYWNRATPLPATGPIHLQTHGGEIRWRNLAIREIGSDEANQILASHNADGFVDVFNGKDLEGWSGSTDNYEIREGAIVCKKGKGGNLFTTTEYSDFVARLEFKLPPGGNNGLAIRFPGKGNPAYDGMCELQVLDGEHPKFGGRLDPRQYHGSPYGMVAAHRGYLRTNGEWNFQEVTVKGSTVKVELNGTVIVDADLSTVTDFMGNRKHPGLGLTTGHFGFAGHNDPVAFRNISIKSLAAGN